MTACTRAVRLLKWAVTGGCCEGGRAPCSFQGPRGHTEVEASPWHRAAAVQGRALRASGGKSPDVTFKSFISGGDRKVEQVLVFVEL